MPDQSAAPNSKTFIVVDGPVKVRTAAGTDPNTVDKTKLLRTGDTVVVDATSRTEVAGIVWWKHNAGWSAERTVDGREVYMIEQTAAQAAQTTATGAQAAQPAATPPAQAPAKKIFLVTDGPVTIRVEPHTEPRLIVAGQTLQTGDDVEVDPTSRTEADGYVWWKHSRGWSAERSIGGSAVFMIEHIPGQPQSLPGAFTFEKFPVAWGTFQWFYYYGNTEFAYQNGAKYNYDGYSQGLHGGIDFGHPGGAQIVAGVTGTFGGRGAAFPPNRLDVLVGKYRIIYGHLANPNTSLVAGQAITPDTPMGQVDGGMKHTHIEIRTSDGVKIVNPLQFISDAMRDQIFTKFPPKGEFAFHPWSQWATPMEQPDIILGGKLVGPRAQP